MQELTPNQIKTIEVLCDIVNFSWGAYTHREVLEQDGIYFADAIESYRKFQTNKLLDKSDRKFLSEMIQSFRLVLTGQTSGVSFFLITALLGKETVKRRIDHAIQAIVPR